MRRVSRRQFFQVAAVGTTSLALSACGNEPETTNLNPTMIADVPDSPPTPTPAGSPAPGEEQAAAPEQTGGVPPFVLKALDPYKWDKTEISVSPGQTIEVTNDGLTNHTFVVDEWSVDESLPSAQPVNVTVPEDATVGDTFTFYCSVPGHRENGMEGTITIVEAQAAPAKATPAGQPAGNAGGEKPAAGGGEPVQLKAEDPYNWDQKELKVSAGQTITVTNDGLTNHDFSVDEWGVNDPLPPGQPVDVVVPDDVAAGDTFTFYCSVPGHRQNGMEGTITIA